MALNRTFHIDNRTGLCFRFWGIGVHTLGIRLRVWGLGVRV